MLHRLPLLLLFLFLLFDLPFISIKHYKKEAFLYENSHALKFLKENPNVKHLIHLTKNTKSRPLFLVTDTLNDTLLEKFDIIYVTRREESNNVPTHTYIGDSILITQNGKDTTIRILKKNNVVIQGRTKFLVKGMPQKIYVIDTIYSFYSYHGALRRYFNSIPFLSFVSIVKGRDLVYTRDSVFKGKHRFDPVIYTIGKNLQFLHDQIVKNPHGFYLAFHDTVLPVPIKSISKTNIIPDSIIAYLISDKKYPLFFVKEGIGYITSTEIDKIARKYPKLFKKIMDEMISLTLKPFVIAYPDRHFYHTGDMATLTVVSIPHIGPCFVERNKSREIIITSPQEHIFLYTFTPTLSDSIIVIECNSAKDTVKITVKPLNPNILYNKDKFIATIRSNSFFLKRPLLGKSRSSPIFYSVLLVSLILVWLFERKKALTH